MIDSEDIIDITCINYVTLELYTDLWAIKPLGSDPYDQISEYKTVQNEHY